MQQHLGEHLQEQEEELEGNVRSLEQRLDAEVDKLIDRADIRKLVCRNPGPTTIFSLRQTLLPAERGDYKQLVKHLEMRFGQALLGHVFHL